MIAIKHYAPAGTPVTIRDIAAGFGASELGTTADIAKSLTESIPGHRVWLVSSGRAAMTLILRAMREECRDTDRDEVIVPAYTCYSVPSAVARAGLRVRTCDVDPRTLSMDAIALAQCKFDKVLAVVSANLYGMPNELGRLENICRQRGVFFLDDGAQALGSTSNGRMVGSFGDAGLFSLDRGKIISTIQGGAVVSNSERLQARLDAIFRDLPPPSIGDKVMLGAKLLGYAVFLRPRLYGVIHNLPFLGLGQTAYETSYPMTRLSRFQSRVAARIYLRLKGLNENRGLRAAEYVRALQDLPGVRMFDTCDGAKAVFARFPIRLAAPSQRSRVLAGLNRAGIGASASYPNSIPDAPEVQPVVSALDADCPGAREVAASIVTLPTHAYCPPDIALKVRKVLVTCLR